MKTNEELQRDVQNAIKWEPLLNAAEIGVTAKDGVITLTGVVDSYSKKTEAENAAKSVTGVKAVAETIEVNYGSSFKKNDTEIANEVLNAWKWNWEVPADKIKVKVESGWVTLEGELEWNYQREAAKKAVANLTGVKGVSNNITIKSESKDAVEQAAVECALERSWSIDDEDVDVKVKGNRVTLTGTVSSLYQKDEAGRLAWNAPGVYSVDNELLVDFDD
ncbi:MAG: BON domain-containing protein [Mucilaginibacter sp.]|jgi:osmotically-inducible protein OsmY|uniref:BON domain-containing protein n=1 Tax=Mucilaginibacter sp. TaxID=1882438 RepID=UPI00326632A3